GIPRIINNVCDGALLQAYARGLPTIDRKLIREVASTLSLDEIPQGVDAAAGKRKKRFWGYFR
ncbi:MAG: hypothetical protein VCB43_05455, partial [Myxococcota bacterium]